MTKETSRRATLAALALAIPTATAAAPRNDLLKKSRSKFADPIYGAIERHKAAMRRHLTTMIDADDAEGKDLAAQMAAARVHHHAGEAMEAAQLALFTTRPTTIEGVAALLEYMSQPDYPDNEAQTFEETVFGGGLGSGNPECVAAARNLLSTIAFGLRDDARGSSY